MANRALQVLPIPFIIGAFVLLAASTGSDQWLKNESHISVQFIDGAGELCEEESDIKSCYGLQFTVLRDVIDWNIPLLPYSGFNIGLWRICVGNECRDWGMQVMTWVGAVRAAMLVSLLLLLAGFAGCIIRLLAPKVPKWLINIFHWAATASAFIAVVAWILRAEEIAWLKTMKVGWSYIAAWVGVFVSLIASVIATLPEQ